MIKLGEVDLMAYASHIKPVTNNLNQFPRHVVHLVREINRQGYGVYIYDKEHRMSANELKNLAGVVTEQARKLQDDIRSETSQFAASMDSAREALGHVRTMRTEVDKAVDMLHSALGQLSNMPPPPKEK